MKFCINKTPVIPIMSTQYDRKVITPTNWKIAVVAMAKKNDIFESKTRKF